jgi:Tol biopolymer transport system component
MRQTSTQRFVLAAGAAAMLLATVGCSSGPLSQNHKLVSKPVAPAGNQTDPRFTGGAWSRSSSDGTTGYQSVTVVPASSTNNELFADSGSWGTSNASSANRSGSTPRSAWAVSGGTTPASILSDLPGLGGSSTLSQTPDRDGPMPENASRVSFASEGADFDPAVSADGSKVYFASTRHSQAANIYVQTIGGTAVTQLTNGPGHDVMPAISPDGQRIAFASERNGSWDIFLMSANGGQAVQVSFDPGHELHPTWSPDGTKIAYCRLSEGSDRWEIWIRDLNSPAKATYLTHGLFPEWHPTENRILFQRPRERGSRYFSVWTIDYRNGEALNPTEIASSATAAIINPTWSTDGKYIAFATVVDPPAGSGASGPKSADIWFARADGSGKTNLTRGHAINLMPTWGPDGTIYFISDRAGQDNIWSIRPEQAIRTASIMGGGNTDLADAPTDNAD